MKTETPSQVSLVIDATYKNFRNLDIRALNARFDGKNVVERFYIMMEDAAETKAKAVMEFFEDKGYSVILSNQYAIMDVVIGMLDATAECDRLALFANRPVFAPFVNYLTEVGVEVDLYAFEGQVHDDLVRAASSFTKLTDADRHQKNQVSPASIPANQSEVLHQVAAA